MNLVWQGGRLEGGGALPESRALTHGYGVFETMLGLGGRLVAGGLHLRRLTEGCRRLGLTAPDERLMAAIEERLGPDRRRVRLQVSDGGLVIVSILEAGPVPDAVAVAVAPWVRNERSPVAGIKCCSYAGNLVALDWARRQGAGEALLGNTRGELCEATMANVFVVLGGRLLTPPLDSGCLPGTARQRVLGLGFPAGEEALPVGCLGEASELFLTSATRGVVPVVRLDGRELGVGETTRRVRQAFAECWFGGRAAG